MNFYTSAWNEYINNNWKDSLTKEFNVTSARIYDGNYNEVLKQEAFNKYYHLKKKYISMEDLLKEKFVNYEKVELFDREKEYELFNNRIKEFIEKEKNKLFKIKAILKKYNIKLELNINDVDFNLLALNKVNRSTIAFYKKLTSLYNKAYFELVFGENKTKNQEIIVKYLKNVGLLYNNASSFLTNRDEYMKYKKDEFYEFTKDINFHDVSVTKYDVNGKDIVIEFEWDIQNIRFKIFNSKVIISKEVGYNIYEPTDLNLTLDIIDDVYAYGYKNFEDINKYLTIYYNITSNERIKVDYIAESFLGEYLEINNKKG